MGDFLVAQLSKLVGIDEFTLTYRLIAWLGTLNIILTLLAASLFALRRLNKSVFGNKNALLKRIVKPLSKLHPIIGMLLLISAYLHGELALGSVFRIHTGALAWFLLVAMLVVVAIGKRVKLKNWIVAHRALAVMMAAAVVVHLYARNLFG
jgi:hypothetical protein